MAKPDELQGEHWFELRAAPGGTVVRHTLRGCAAGKYWAIWRERIEPLHDLMLEALLDNVEAAAASGPTDTDPRAAPKRWPYTAGMTSSSADPRPTRTPNAQNANVWTASGLIKPKATSAQNGSERGSSLVASRPVRVSGDPA